MRLDSLKSNSKKKVQKMKTRKVAKEERKMIRKQEKILKKSRHLKKKLNKEIYQNPKTTL